jgi:hypothetical protein
MKEKGKIKGRTGLENFFMPPLPPPQEHMSSVILVYSCDDYRLLRQNNEKSKVSYMS